MSTPTFNTLQEAKDYLKANWEKGTDCPCCGQFVKLYKRRLNAGACRALIFMYRLERDRQVDEEWDGWIHVQQDFAKYFRVNANSMDYSQAQWWELIESKPNVDDPTKKDSGYWKLTPRGKLFVQNKLEVMSHAYLYNNKRLGFTGNKITVETGLGKKFNYQELMSE